VICKFAYGREKIALDLRGLPVRHLRPEASRPKADVERLLARALDNPLDGVSLTDLARDRSQATIIVPDATRKLPLQRMLPVLLTRLGSAGIDRGRVKIILANGTHPRADGDTLRVLLGEELGDLSIQQHDCRDETCLVPVGTTSQGNLIRLNRIVVESDLLITIGAIRHHYFAGFGGGPKMVFPGVAGYDEIQANHSRVIERGRDGLRRTPQCEPGLLDGNPVAEEIAEAAAMRPPDMALCTVSGENGEVAWIGVGSWQRAFHEAVDLCRTRYEILPRRFRLAVACGGGAPSDSTLIQAHKGLDAICRFVEPGGEVLFLAEMGEGAGSFEMEPFLEDPDPDRILGRLARRWIQYGHTTLRIVEKTRRIRCFLFSQLDTSLSRRLGFENVGYPEQVIERWREELPGEVVGVMPGAAVFPRAH
jgi:nickel-dependent lactate racemase